MTRPPGKVEWPHLLADLKAKREALDQVIAVIETHFIGDDSEAMPASAPPTGRTTRSHAPRPQRPAADDIGSREHGRREKILALLAAGPRLTREIAAALKVDRKVTKTALQRMAKVGLIAAIGIRAGRRWTLPVKSAKHDLALASPRRTVDAVEARDRQILACLRAGEASFPAVLAMIETEDGWTAAQHAEACTLALRRLCLKKHVVKVGDSYRLAS